MDGKNEITYFAETDARNKRVRFGIKDKDRLRHIYSIGKTGMGKSTMLENMAIQDIQNGKGMAFLDPHGKTADLLLDYIPESRKKDVIYFAPFDTDFPISFNAMEDVGPDRRHLVVSGLMSAFEKFFGEESFSDRMQYILQNTILALLEYPGATMLGINRMLTDKEYRNKVIANITDPSVKNYWVKEYAGYTERFAAEAIPAIQNKIGQFTSNPLVRNIIGQPKSSFDIREVMDKSKILIINLSKGLVGEGNASLLGSMLVTKIYLAAMSRADVSPQEMAKLPNFYLYVDEFQSFANKSFADILSEARKYHLSLNITHQYIEQMAEEVRAAVFGNVGTMISFRVGSYDAEIFEKEFAPVFTMEDIVNLGFVQIYLKLMIDGVASQPFSATTLPPIAKPEVSFREKVLEMSRKNYTKPKEEVEKAIKEWHLPEQKIELRIKNNELSKEKKEFKIEHRVIDRPKIETRAEKSRQEIRPERKEEKNNILAKALAEVVKGKSELRISPPIGRAGNYELRKKEESVDSNNNTKPIRHVSLEELKHGERNQNKGPSPDKQNALREALERAKNRVVTKSSVNESIKEEVGKKTEPKSPKEVPEDVLRKILKGE
ncbi:MAG: hypothetical protein AAB392_01930 [Patescibacteria group bacterium]